jgi:UDP-glucose 4-epimerase
MTQARRALFSGQKVLVTGASGFLGSHLCRRLIEEGAEIHALSRSARRNGRDSIRWWQADMTDIAATRRILAETKPAVIFHLAGLVTAAAGLELVLPTLHSLLVSTVNVLTVGAETGCGRVVLAASLTEPIPGHTEATPSSPYAAAKWAGSAYGRMFCKLYGLPVVIVRPFMTYGPGQDNRKLIPYATLSLLRGESPNLSSGNWEADWVYIDDVIDGLLTAAQVPAIPESTIDLGSGTLVPVRTIVQHLVNLTGSRTAPTFGAIADRPLEQVRVADLRYASKTLGWKPTVPLLEGLERTVDWYGRAIKDEIA